MHAYVCPPPPLLKSIYLKLLVLKMHGHVAQVVELKYMCYNHMITNTQVGSTSVYPKRSI